MKGILKKTDKGWVVDYIHPNKRHLLKVPAGQGWRNDIHVQLPITQLSEAILENFWLKDGSEVEFKKVNKNMYSNHIEPAEIEAQLVLNQVEPQENWDEIFQDFLKIYNPMDLGYHAGIGQATKWLKENFEPPMRKKK